jgi:hypothetical protein
VTNLSLTDVAALPERYRRQIHAQLEAQPNVSRKVADAPASVAAKAVTTSHTPGRMNKTEEAYSRILECRKARGEVVWFAFEAVRLRIADKCYYTPDFLVQLADGTLEIHEVKARTKDGRKLIKDDAAVKLRAIHDQYPMFGLRIAWGCRGEFEMERR